jgi:hypothetical protein
MSIETHHQSNTTTNDKRIKKSDAEPCVRQANAIRIGSMDSGSGHFQVKKTQIDPPPHKPLAQCYGPGFSW